MKTPKKEQKTNQEKRGRTHHDSSNQAFAKEADQVLSEQKTDPEQGLSDDEVKKCREEFGENALPERGGTKPFTDGSNYGHTGNPKFYHFLPEGKKRPERALSR